MVIAILNWIFTARETQWGIYVTKPAVILLLMAWMVVAGWIHGGLDLLPLLLFFLALAFCLAGDVFLMLHARYFQAGLFFFLIGHLFYTVGFFQCSSPQLNPNWLILLTGVLVLSGFWLVRRLFVSLALQGQRKFRIPILVYGLTISAMLFMAVSRMFDPLWPSGPAILAAAGAVLFYISDFINAWNRFVSPVRNGGLWIMASYHVGQACLAVGIVSYLTLSQI